MTAFVDIVAKVNRDAKMMASIVDCFDKCGFALTRTVAKEALDAEHSVWIKLLPRFETWLKSLSEKSLYKHLLESLNHACEDEGGSEIIRDLTDAELEMELAQLDSDSDAEDWSSEPASELLQE